MAPRMEPEARMEPNKRKGPTLTLIVVIVATLGGLSAIDVFLARMEASELASEARHYYDQGSRLLDQGRALDAVNVLGKAHATERNNPAYEVELAQALISAGKIDEAETLLEDLLERAPNDGDANLLEARLMAQQHQTGQAVAYYHRAIYGLWRANSEARRIATRLELAQFLASRGDTTDLLAELLPLESEVREDTGTLQQVAKLYLRAGSPARAEITYRALIKENPHDHPEDAGNYAGLGDAELAQGNYRNAEAAYRSAARLNDGSQFEQRLQFAETMAALDPTVRWLSSTEKYRRSMRILQLARDTLNRCAQSDEAKGLMADTDKVLAEKIRGPMNNELAEDRLALAGQLWETRLTSCGPSTSPGEESLRLVMAKLAQ
jgi:tetratricopeptide (TPR) repeat protein